MGGRGGEKKQETENFFEKIIKNFPNLAKEIHFQEAQSVPKKFDLRKHTPRQKNMAHMKEQIKAPEKNTTK